MIYRSDDFELDTDLFELRRGGAATSEEDFLLLAVRTAMLAPLPSLRPYGAFMSVGLVKA